ncbi:MAG: pilus assembly PilX N-terminal domain-containing protein [Phycisphaerae bacterium]|nr:pilus assembly PilX N-terminal domain-containing protein [Phycisphaerae bacterium]
MFRKKRYRKKYKGIALIIAMLFVMVFSALSVAMFSMSSGNSLVASNLHRGNEARSSAESGLEVVRYYLAQAEIPGITPQSQWFEVLQSQLMGGGLPSGMYASLVEDGGVTTGITIGSSQSVTLGSNQSFAAEVSNSDDRINILVIGNAGDVERKIQGSFIYGEKPEPYSVFDFGVATKGPLSLSGNILLEGVNISVESDVYIESMEYNQTLEIIGNSQIAGDVKVVNPEGYVTLQGGQAGIGGETGVDAINNHVQIGAPQTQFPIPNTSYFEQYVNGITIDSSTDLSTITTLNNVRIAAGTNPSFTSDVQINGVLYVEQPNTVSFAGNVNITGIIVGDGDYTDNSRSNQITFNGTVSSSSVATLPESFGDLRDDTGTFIMAPGFAVSMGGNFGTLNGCIAANGVDFFGNAGGVIGGSVLNYSDQPMELSGNSDLFFNRTGNTEIPNGFEPVLNIVIKYDPSAYDEII